MLENSGLTDFSGLWDDLYVAQEGTGLFYLFNLSSSKAFLCFFFILLSSLHCSESLNIYGCFLTTEETYTLLVKLSFFLSKEFQDRKEYHRIVHIAERPVLQEITVSCMFILYYHM